MVVLATALISLCSVSCEPVQVGCWEYLTAECATDVFVCWSDIPMGERPAHCGVDAECLPVEWTDCEVVRRLSSDCEC